MKTTYGGLYEIRNVENGRRYIGSSYDVNKRLAQHLCQLKSNKHGNIILQRAWNKYGERAFIMKLVAVVEQNLLLELEQRFVDRLKLSGAKLYNLARECTNPVGGLHKNKITKSIWLAKLRSESHRQKQSAGMTAHMATEAGRAQRKATMANPDTKKKQSDSLKAWWVVNRDRLLPTRKHNHTAEQKVEIAKKRSESFKIRWQDPVYLAKMLIARKTQSRNTPSCVEGRRLAWITRRESLV